MTQASGSPGKCGAKTAHQWSSVNLNQKTPENGINSASTTHLVANYGGTRAQPTIYIHVVMPIMVHIVSYRNCGKNSSECQGVVRWLLQNVLWWKQCGKTWKKQIAVIAAQIPWNPHKHPKAKKAKSLEFQLRCRCPYLVSWKEHLTKSSAAPHPLQGYKYLHQEWGFMVYGNNSMIQLKTVL